MIGVALAAPSWAERVTVPVELSYDFLGALAREQAFRGPGHSVRLNDDGTGCQYLELRDPAFGPSGTRVKLTAAATARAGRKVGGQCLLGLDWRGRLELTQRAALGADGRSVMLHTETWRAVRADGTTDTVSTTLGRWVEQWLPFDLRNTRIELAQPLSDLASFLAESTADGAASDGLHAALETLALDRVDVGARGVTATLGMEAPVGGPPPAGGEAPLSDAELARLEERLEALDAFVTYTAKHLAQGPDAADADALLETLLELRRDVVSILVAPRRGDQDAARTLFARAWDQLTPLLRGAAAQPHDHTDALRYLSFIGAGDMLRALDRLGPATGVDVSTDGLRRLARMLAPEDPRDPVRYDDAVDAELREALGFGAPLPPPQDAVPTSWLDWLVPTAVAAAGLDPAVVKRLNNWVPRPRDMSVYLPMVRDVLQYVVSQQLGAGKVQTTFHRMYRSLVLTAAWQESCWRQFVAKNDKRVPMQSASGDLGLMQVNPTVWRGFYELHGLRWDIVYNARAGADILEHLLLKYAIAKGEHTRTGAIDNLARSTYAAYNGGPRQYDRYRRSNASERGKTVDRVFWEKYRVVNGGRDLGVSACYSQ